MQAIYGLLNIIKGFIKKISLALIKDYNNSQQIIPITNFPVSSNLAGTAPLMPSSHNFSARKAINYNFYLNSLNMVKSINNNVTYMALVSTLFFIALNKNKLSTGKQFLGKHTDAIITSGLSYLGTPNSGTSNNQKRIENTASAFFISIFVPKVLSGFKYLSGPKTSSVGGAYALEKHQQEETTESVSTIGIASAAFSATLSVPGKVLTGVFGFFCKEKQNNSLSSLVEEPSPALSKSSRETKSLKR